MFRSLLILLYLRKYYFFFFLSIQSDLPVREKIFLLLDAAQTSLGGASGRFPQYYSAYYELVVSKLTLTLHITVSY